jgi:alpha-glucuronidase
VLLSLSATASRAETGYDGWLRYAPLEDAARRRQYESLPKVVAVLDDSTVAQSAREELIRGIRGMLNSMVRAQDSLPDDDAIVLGTVDEIRTAIPDVGALPEMAEDGFLLKSVARNGRTYLHIAGSNDRGVLYGVFALLRRIALGLPVDELDVCEEPYAPIRFLNHWDNLDGTIERGYAGKSIFWDDGHVTKDLRRVGDYARLMASVGINGCSINNVNADTRVITAELLPEVARIGRRRSTRCTARCRTWPGLS